MRTVRLVHLLINSLIPIYLKTTAQILFYSMAIYGMGLIIYYVVAGDDNSDIKTIRFYAVFNVERSELNIDGVIIDEPVD